METCADFLIKRLFDWGVRRIYSYPGDGINGIMGALGRAENNSHSIEFIPRNIKSNYEYAQTIRTALAAPEHSAGGSTLQRFNSSSTRTRRRGRTRAIISYEQFKRPSTHVRHEPRNQWHGDAETPARKLQAVICGEIRFDSGARALYSTDSFESPAVRRIV
jgi:hypothetical protein